MTDIDPVKERYKEAKKEQRKQENESLIIVIVGAVIAIAVLVCGGVK